MKMTRNTFGKFEVDPCKDFVDSDNERCVERCIDEEAEFYGVYRRKSDCTALWIKDFDVRKDAIEYAQLLNEKVKDHESH